MCGRPTCISLNLAIVVIFSQRRWVFRPASFPFNFQDQAVLSAFVRSTNSPVSCTGSEIHKVLVEGLRLDATRGELHNILCDGLKKRNLLTLQMISYLANLTFLFTYDQYDCPVLEQVTLETFLDNPIGGMIAVSQKIQS